MKIVYRMRTRSSGAVSPPSSPQQALPAPRGKKRGSTSKGDAQQPTPPPSSDPSSPDAPPEGFGGHNDNRLLLTPRKAKRVRFSEPNRTSEHEDVETTGLTPFLRKTKLSTGIHGAPRRLNQLRRASMPASLDLGSTSLSDIQEIQFEPLRQMLSGRIRRRLRRAHLSEEVNNAEADERERKRNNRELEQLRAEGQKADDKIKELMFELESQRQLHIQVGTEDEAETHALEEELERLRRELDERKREEEDRRRLEGTPTEWDTDDEDLMADRLEPSSPMVNGIGISSSSPVFRDNIPSSPLPPSSPPTNATPRKDDIEETMKTQIENAVQQTSIAKEALRDIRSELLTLGFTNGQATSEEIIDNIKNAFRDTRLELERLLPGETPGGFENVLLLPAILDHIQNLVGKVREKERAVDAQSQTESALRRQFNITLEKLGHLENEKTVIQAQHRNNLLEIDRKDQHLRNLQQTADARANIVGDRDAFIEKLEEELQAVKGQVDHRNAQIEQLETEHQERNISIDRLQNAVESYRTEVASLERLVGKLEQDKQHQSSKIDHVSADGAASVQQLKKTVEEMAVFMRQRFQQTQQKQADACAEAEEFIKSKLSSIDDH